MSPEQSRPCGLYRTTSPLPGREERVPAGRLVFYHNHSEQGPPLVLLPKASEHNRWRLHPRGWLVEDPAWPLGLAPLLPEGLYVLREHIHLRGRETVLPARSLVQLGYDRAGQGILFPAAFSGLTISFPAKGWGVDADALGRMTPAGFLVPSGPEHELLH